MGFEVGDRYLIQIGLFYRHALVVYASRTTVLFYLNYNLFTNDHKSWVPLATDRSYDYNELRENCYRLGVAIDKALFWQNNCATKIIQKMPREDCIHCGIALERCTYHGPQRIYN